jgi:gliding motility-associated-like protein
LIETPEPATKLTGLTAGSYSLQLMELRSGCRTNRVPFEILDETFSPVYQVYTEPALCDEKSGLIRIIPQDAAAIEKVVWYSTYGKDVVSVGLEVTEMFAGEYRYEVFAVNGCSSSGTVVLEADINVYNGLSPNGDGENDIFHIDCIEKFPENSVKIFNRAGALVYEADYYDNVSTFFEGRGNRGVYVGGKELPDGTYFYVIEKNDGSKPKTGYLELSW